ncbi:MAG: hypothetical protein ABSC01_08670, partial [Verrucomicrobiota bacterium]
RSSLVFISFNFLMFSTEDAALATWPHSPLLFSPRNLAEDLGVFGDWPASAGALDPAFGGI